MIIAALVCLLIYAGGVAFRFAYIFHWHPPNNYVYSDMAGYVGTASAWFHPGHQFGPPDAFVPPLYHWLLGYLLHLDRSRNLAVIVQFLMSVAVPPMLGLMAYQLYGRAVALVSLAMSSVYFPFIDYAGYFLTENPFLFIMLLSMLLLVSAIRARRGWLSQTWALLGGAALGASANIKPAVLLCAALVFVWLAGAAWKHRWSRLLLVMLTSVVGMTLVMLPLSLRATRINGGSFVLVSTNGPMNMQQGHAGENVSGVIFRDPKSGGTWQWGSPTTSRKAEMYRREMLAAGLKGDPNRFCVTNHFDFAPWDRDRLNQAIWQRIRQAPLECLAQSCNNVVETLFTALPWPTASLEGTPWFHLSIWSQRVFIWLMLLPAFLHLLIRRRALRDKQGPGLADGLMALPFLGLIITVFLATPEIRYRVPFDAFVLVLAARFYTLGAARPDGLVPIPSTLSPGERAG